MKNNYNFTDTDLLITYSWGDSDHGICGHLFEVIDYFWVLKDFFKTKILLCEINLDLFLTALTSKYNFTAEELDYIIKNTIFKFKPKILICKSILFTDGSVPKISKIVIKAENKFMFSCSKFELTNNMKDFKVLEDFRVYSNEKNINYIKKILFDRLKSISSSTNDTLLYLTNNCRSVDLKTLDELTETNNTFLCISDAKIELNKPNVKFEKPPILNLFEKFKTYVYTPINRKWDCSSRFIAECKYYDKDVIYYNIDYFEEDLGLYYRKYDVDTQFESLFLTENDDLIKILKRYI